MWARGDAPRIAWIEHGQAALLAPAAALHVVDVVTDQHELSRDVLRLERVAILRLLV